MDALVRVAVKLRAQHAPTAIVSDRTSSTYQGSGDNHDISTLRPRRHQDRASCRSPRLIPEIPGMRMCRVDPTEAREKLPRAHLKAGREGQRRRVGFFELDTVRTKDDVGVELEIRIDIRRNRHLERLEVEAVLRGVVPPLLQIVVVVESRQREVGNERNIRIERDPRTSADDGGGRGGIALV